MVLRQRKFHHDLKLALAGIQQGSYGICRITRKQLPPERLRAVPHATLYVEAKARSGSWPYRWNGFSLSRFSIAAFVATHCLSR